MIESSIPVERKVSRMLPNEPLIFALTPPRGTVSQSDAAEIAQRTMRRVESVRPDAVILYDIADESDRTATERPFPFLPTLDPATYWDQHLRALGLPVIIYRSVGKYDQVDLERWMRDQDTSQVSSVFVGAASSQAHGGTSLSQAYAIRNTSRPDLLLGGVAIPERHARRGDEHLKLARKRSSGCSFFVTQVVFDGNAAKNLASDYRYWCETAGVTPASIVFTFSVIGSVKTLEFMHWLGVDVPRWIENDVRNSRGPLQVSRDHALGIASDLINYCRRSGIPFGINVESVSSRHSEIDQVVELAGAIGHLLGR